MLTALRYSHSAAEFDLEGCTSDARTYCHYLLLALCFCCYQGTTARSRHTALQRWLLLYRYSSTYSCIHTVRLYYTGRNCTVHPLIIRAAKAVLARDLQSASTLRYVDLLAMQQPVVDTAHSDGLACSSCYTSTHSCSSLYTTTQHSILLYGTLLYCAALRQLQGPLSVSRSKAEVLWCGVMAHSMMVTGLLMNELVAVCC
jgi:hypothetical protein